MGPTASGKTRVAVELVRRAPLEIVSVDSALVYRGLDIGSGKPDAATLRAAPHRLVDIRDPGQAYSAAEFRRDALGAMEEIREAGKIPLLVGGTMLYFKVLREGLANMPEADPAVRARILGLARREGWEAVHRRLAEVDPAAAARIHPTDPQRLQRALEVFELAGKPLSELHRAGKSGRRGEPALPFRLVQLAMVPPERAVLHRRIEARLRQMLEAGFVEEVRALRARGDLDRSLPAMRSVGYRQIWDYLAGDCDYETMVARALAATRQLAKRQLTWLRGWPELGTLNSEDPDIVEKCLKFLPSGTRY